MNNWLMHKFNNGNIDNNIGNQEKISKLIILLFVYKQQKLNVVNKTISERAIVLLNFLIYKHNFLVRLNCICSIKKSSKTWFSKII